VTFTNNYIEENHGNSGMFATVFFAILDPRSGRRKYVNCGHRLTLIAGKKGSLRALPLTGPAIGAICRPVFTVLTEALMPGELLFAYIDRLTDAVNLQEEPFTLVRLKPVLACGSKPSHVVADVQQNLNKFCRGARQFDDMPGWR